VIVADTNLIVYLLLEGPLSEVAERIFRSDPSWTAPGLWRTEFRNILTDDEKGDLLQLLGEKRETHRYGQACLRCGYCLPCPQGIEIPEVFRTRTIVESYPETLRETGYEIYDNLETQADECVECRQCVEKCPAGLDIPARLQAAHEVLVNYGNCR
jgi:predicted aldo/keto reductase-like oxidoreductase